MPLSEARLKCLRNIRFPCRLLPFGRRKNGKRKAQIKSEKDEVLRRYHIAKRILFEEKKIDKVDVSEWQSEVASLQDSYQEEYDKYKELSSETKSLRDINKYIDDAIRSTHPRRKEEPIR